MFIAQQVSGVFYFSKLDISFLTCLCSFVDLWDIHAQPNIIILSEA